MSGHQEGSGGLNILCIDGGGVRGLSPLIILREIMRRAAHAKSKDEIHPHEYFDVIAGAGTGGISACMLGRLRMPIDKAIEQYAKLAQDVFKDKKMTGPTMYKRTKLDKALKTMVRNVTRNEGEMMNEGREDNGCKTVVFAMAKHNNVALPVMFRSYTVTTNPGPDCTISEALNATMAHPDLFEGINIVDSSVSQSFVGGELGCSNPLAHVLSEIARIYPDRLVGCVVSIGAGHTRTIKIPDLSRWHRTQDVIVMKDMAVDAERVAEEMMLRFQGTSGVYFRFNVDQGMQDMKNGSWERLGEAMQHTNAYLQRSKMKQELEGVAHAGIGRRRAIPTTHVARQIGVRSLQALEATQQLAGFKRCPAPTKFYTGREEENTQVIECITGGKGERRVCIVHGLGGVGKTQLVLNVIERTWDEWEYIIYVDASSAEAVEKALTEFGTVKSIGGTHENVITWLESCGERWLVVFEAVDTPSTNIARYIPARSQNGSVIITTRLSDLVSLAEGLRAVCHLSSMSQSDGTALLLKITSSGKHPLDDMKIATLLVQDFEGLALAIIHAGAYIAHSLDMSVYEYRSLFLSQRQRMIKEYSELPVTAKPGELRGVVYTTLRMCYEQLKPESCQLLWLIAYLHHDGITQEIFERAAQNTLSRMYPFPLTNLESQTQTYVKQYLSTFLDGNANWDTVKFMNVLADLTSHSLVELDAVNNTCRLHPLVHDWAKAMVPHTPEFMIECAATLLSLSIGWEQDSHSLAYIRQLQLHITSALTHNPNTGANHIYRFERVYECTRRWGQRMKLLQSLIAYSKRALGEEHPDTLDSMNSLASTYSNLGRYDKAEQLGIQVVNARKRVLGEEHPDTLNSMNSLASIYSSLGRYNEAEQLGTQVVNARKRLLGEEHPSTLNSMNSLASIYSNLGRHSEAEQLEVQVVDAYKRLLGEDHPDTLQSLSNLASNYSSLGRYNEAEQLGTQVVNARKRLLGEEHPSTLNSMNSLASIYSNLGRHSEAEQLEVQVVNAYKRLLGEDHPDTLQSLSNLALIYLYLDRHNEAEQLGIQVVSARKRVLGEEHPDTLNSMDSLASIYSNLGRYDEAVQLQLQALDAYVRVLGEHHPDTITITSNLILNYFNLGRYDEAEQLGVQLVDAHKKLLGEDNPSTLTSMSTLAINYSHMHRHDKAEQLKVQVLNTRKKILGEMHPDTLASMNNLAITYSYQGRHAEAEQLKIQATNASKRVLGDEHPNTLLFMGNLASTYSHLGRHEEAEWLRLQVVNASKRRLGEEHSASPVSLMGLARIYEDVGRHAEAERLDDRVLNAHKRMIRPLFQHILGLSQSNWYCCDPRVMALRCFQNLQAMWPRYNICGLKSSFAFDSTVAGLEIEVRSRIPIDLVYAAQHWAVYLSLVSVSPDLLRGLKIFLSSRLLEWIEVMVLKGCAHEMPKDIRLVKEWVGVDSACSEDLRALVDDTWRFTKTFTLGAISTSTPHIYLSMLPFWPNHSPIAKHHPGSMQQVIGMEGTTLDRQQNVLLATWHFSGTTKSPVISPDGCHIAMGVGHVVLVLDASTGQLALPPFEEHSDMVLIVQFSPDGTRIVSSSLDRTIRVWSLQCGATTSDPIIGHKGTISFVSFSPHGLHILSGSQDGTLFIWDSLTGALLLGPLMENGAICHVKYTADGRSIIVCTRNRIVVRSAEDGRILRIFSDSNDAPFYSVDISPDCTHIASGSIDNSIYIWNVRSGQVVLRFPSPADTACCHEPFVSVSFSPDGSRLASSSRNKRLCLWDTQTGKLVHGPLEGHTDDITSVRFSPDGTYIISGSHDKTLRLWSTQNIPSKLELLPGHDDPVTSIRFTPDGAQIVSRTINGTVCSWNSQNGDMLPPSSEDLELLYFWRHIAVGPTWPDLTTQPVVFSSEGSHTILGSTKNSTQVLVVNTGKTHVELCPPITSQSRWAHITSIASSRDSSRIAIGSIHYSFSIHDGYSGQLLYGPFDGCTNKFNALAFSPDGTCIISGSLSTVQVQNAQNGKIILGPLKGHMGWVISVDYSLDGAYIVSGAKDGSICVWDAQTGESVIGPVKWHTGAVNSVKFSPDSTRVVSGSDDKTIRVTNVRRDLDFLSHSSTPTGTDWELSEDGWVKDKAERLLTWVPPELRTALMWPRTELLISTRGWLRLNFANARIGESWMECYKPLLDGPALENPKPEQKGSDVEFHNDERHKDDRLKGDNEESD